MIVVWMNPSPITPPRAPPIEVRSPAVKFLPRKITKCLAIDVITFCNANAGAALTKPKAVVSFAGLSPQIEITTMITSAAVSKPLT